MNATVNCRLTSDNAEWMPHFVQRTGAPTSKIVNEAIRLAKEILERRLSSGDVLFPSAKPGDGNTSE